jgi:hypothetical protein
MGKGSGFKEVFQALPDFFAAEWLSLLDIDQGFVLVDVPLFEAVVELKDNLIDMESRGWLAADQGNQQQDQNQGLSAFSGIVSGREGRVSPVLRWKHW